MPAVVVLAVLLNRFGDIVLRSSARQTDEGLIVGMENSYFGLLDIAEYRTASTSTFREQRHMVTQTGCLDRYAGIPLVISLPT